MIMEDDFMIHNMENFNNFITDFENIKNDNNWNIITLTPRGYTDKTYTKYNDNNFLRIIHSCTTTCYIIKTDFINILQEKFNIGVQNMLKGESKEYNALDIMWIPLQHEYIFLYYNKIFAKQLPSYSDIENHYVDYTERFITQLQY